MKIKKKIKKSIDIIFIILREETLGHKDIDHILPFLYFLSKNKNFKYTARGIIFGSKANYTKDIDPRVKFLFNLKNVELEFVSKDNFLFKIKRLLGSGNKSILGDFFNRMVSAIYIRYLNIIQKNHDLKNNLGEVFLKSKSPLIITLHGNKEALNIAKQIKKYNRKAKWMMIPHGTINCDNKMLLDSHLDKTEKPRFGRNYNSVDYMLATTKHELEEEISQGMSRDRGYVIGALRYCKEWLKIKSNLGLDGKEVRVNKNYKIKASFFIPKKNANIFWEELIRTIDFISSYREIELIILNYNPYFPKLPNRIAKRDNIRQYLISKEYSTSKIIDWSDIVFHAGSSVVYEFFMKDKVSIYLRHLTCNILLSDVYNAGFNLRTRDEVRNICNDAVNSLNELKKIYKKKCRVSNKKFNDDLVNANLKSVKSNINKIMYKICNNLQNDK